MGGNRRLAYLVTALIMIVLSAGFFVFLGYADEHKYDPGFDWVSGSTMQMGAVVMLGFFVFGLLCAIAGLREKPADD
jgi:succinate dehydrogenase hydrophobic anchor subunit